MWPLISDYFIRRKKSQRIVLVRKAAVNKNALAEAYLGAMYLGDQGIAAGHTAGVALADQGREPFRKLT